jgi:UTP--glucose-1-phosphate uridylyltransferase
VIIPFHMQGRSHGAKADWQNFEKRFKSIPNINELDHLTISGDVWIGKGVRLAGTCILVANEGSKIMIPDGTNLENKLVTGNLSIIDH